jgi:hypothetical protein
MPKGIILGRESALAVTCENKYAEQEDLPRNPQPAERLLDIDECSEDAYQHAAGGEHNEYPEIQLLIGPIVALAYDDALARDTAPHAGDVRGSQFGMLMGLVDRRSR